LDEAEVAAGDACDGGDRFGVGEVVSGERGADRGAVVLEDERELVAAERPVFVGEADA
jgi:hypothetical protein